MINFLESYQPAHKWSYLMLYLGFILDLGHFDTHY